MEPPACPTALPPARISGYTERRVVVAPRGRVVRGSDFPLPDSARALLARLPQTPKP